MSSLVTIKEPSHSGNVSRCLSRHIKVRSLPIVLATAFVTACLIASFPAAAADNTVTLEISNFVYSPEIVTVTAGTTVIWINHDDVPHTVTATEKAFRSPPLDAGDSFKFTFTTPGDYLYFCALHPHMTGEVIVKPSAG